MDNTITYLHNTNKSTTARHDARRKFKFPMQAPFGAYNPLSGPKAQK